ncbi:MAG: DsbE family thiol:disulfide interchange protein [Gammaproteobacteria bacterium]|jgi:cytochrome c biogenesis protein CcmG/thiol:disulfide interchange protein DsbE|nr:DsbE family thiol:disulfide interchange protein [Gammaproteobacteria bacterium]MBT5052994.1 DsbE family thiol:disulfide interchange protein [Gammaproteobacteria bacterium]
MAKQSVLIPVFVFAGIVVLLWFGFQLSDPHLLPSQKLNDPVPEFELPNLMQVDQTLTAADLTGEVSLLNVWATWCPSCIAEHGELTRIFETTGLRIIGVNYNDDSEAARAWLKRWGDPYAFHIVDESGTLAIDLGVYGAPETFVVDAGGVIRYRHVGVVTQKVFEETLTPLIQNLKDAS